MVKTILYAVCVAIFLTSCITQRTDCKVVSSDKHIPDKEEKQTLSASVSYETESEGTEQ